jgi:hypothetical protein
MMQQPTLSDRVDRCVRSANAGQATMLIVGVDQLDEARRLVGQAPVVVCDSADAVRFLEFLRKPRRRRG